MGADLIMEWFASPPGRDEEACYSAALQVIEEMEKFVKEKPWRKQDEDGEPEGEPLFDNINEFAGEFLVYDPSWVNTLSEHEFNEEEYIGTIGSALNQMKDFDDTYWRFKTSNTIGDWTIHIVGDSSWGDSPPEPWEYICRLKYSAGKVWNALGYHWPKDCVPFSKGEQDLPDKTHFQLNLGI
jgi:hypothetical protein